MKIPPNQPSHFDGSDWICEYECIRPHVLGRSDVQPPEPDQLRFMLHHRIQGGPVPLKRRGDRQRPSFQLSSPLAECPLEERDL